MSRGKQTRRTDTPGARLRGNLSILFLGASVAIFWFWTLYFDFPPAIHLKALGWDFLPTDWLHSINSLILGGLGLSGILSSHAPKELLTHLHRPYDLLQHDLKRVYSSWGCCTFSLVAFVFFAIVCSANVTASVEAVPPEMGLILALEENPDVVLLQRADDETGYEIGHEARLSTDRRVSIVFRGYAARAEARLRDRYNLLTLESFRLQREPARIDVQDLSLSLSPTPGGVLSPAEVNLLRLPPAVDHPDRLRTSRWRLTFQRPFRFQRRLPNRIIGQSGHEYRFKGGHHLFLRATNGTPCPATAPEGYPEIQEFWNELCDQQQQVARWRNQPVQWESDDWGYVALELPNHRLKIPVIQARRESGSSTHEAEPLGMWAWHRDAPRDAEP